MAVNDLSRRYPELGRRLPYLPLADLPTPVDRAALSLAQRDIPLAIKRDDITASRYGGNKVRKLEYLLQEARDQGAERVATFGTVASHHALATAIFAAKTGFACTCFLSHQSKYPGVGDALRVHQSIGTDIVRFGGRDTDVEKAQRDHLAGSKAFIVPMGGSSPRGTLGYVNAGLELAAQIEAGEAEHPERIYIALGTVGTAAGLALGLALAELDTEINAVAVSADEYSGEHLLRRMIADTAALMHAADASMADDVAERVNVVRRDSFFGPGYGKTDETTERAIGIAREQLGLRLEHTYTGKAMACMISDLEAGYDGRVLFWNTYNSRPLGIDRRAPPDLARMPEEFARYFDDG